MKIIVTGGAGFIASHVVDRYIELGHEVVVVDDLSTGYHHNLNPKAKFYFLDICSKDLVKVFDIEKPDLVNHHAAQISVPVSVTEPLKDLDTNAKGFMNVLENCVKYCVKKVIFISSGGAVYGEADEYPTSETYSPKPLSPYAIHKYVSEMYLYYYNHAFGLNYTTLRYANVYGPRQVSHGEAGVVSIFIEKYLKDENPYLYAYPEAPDGMIRDYVYVKDVIEANVLAIEKADLKAINIGTGIETTTGELLREVSKQMGKDFNPIKGEPRPGDIRKSCLVVDYAKRILDWTPKHTLQEGIKETIEFFRGT